MSLPESHAIKFYRFACLFEFALAGLAVLLGWLVDINPFQSLQITESAVSTGILMTLPMLLLYFVLRSLPFHALQQIQHLLRDTLGKPLAGRNWADLLILASIAGFSEEALFRGGLQPWLEQSINPWLALLVSNLVFALVHAVTPVYAVLALVMGLYLGWSLDLGGERNLLQPMIVHSLYDFIAFMVIVREYRQLQRNSNAE